MDYIILVIAVISITIGIFVGALIVWFIYFWRRRQVVDSLIKPEDVVGLYGTVEIPFNADSKGKIRVNIKGSMVDLIAITEESRELNTGERALIIQMKENKVLVVSENYINKK